MRRRAAFGVAAFMLALGVFEVAFLVFGAPRAIGPVIGLVLSTLIVLDPGELLPESPGR